MIKVSSVTEARWKTVSIPRYLADLIQEDIVKNGKYGYHSLSSFVEDAVRKRLRELGYKV